MEFNFIRFCEDYNISHREHGKNWQKGWVQICCPWCADDGFHGGFNKVGSYYHCWKCGGHSLKKLITELAGVNYKTVQRILRIYLGQNTVENMPTANENPKTLELPAGLCDFQKMHLKYIITRKFDPSILKRQWGVRGTSNLGDYKFRLFIPIIHNTRMVSYLGRDITNKQELRYKACKKDKEVIHHKHILYGCDYVSKNCIVVEGVTDVWRVGPGAIATMGTAYTTEQLNFIKEKEFNRISILFDYNATDRAINLQTDLSMLGINSKVLQLDKGDPGELNEIEVKQVRKLGGI